MRTASRTMIAAVLTAFAAAAALAYAAAPDQEPAIDRTALDGGAGIDMDVTVPERVAAMLREHPIPGVRVAAVIPDGSSNP